MTDLEQAQAAAVAPWDLTVPDLSNFHITVFQDRYPVAVGHLLFVPNYNTSVTIADAFEAALIYGNNMVAAGKFDAFNVGINMGSAAGQTVMYPHVHMIPRRTGDCADPVGGVRGVIAGQANYHQSGYQQPR
jgi:diadenosine tetraphosphate (Ap4A) HIT family hydrolase